MVNRLRNEVEFVDQIVRDLCRENFSAFERTYQKSEQYIKALNRIDKLANKLHEILPEEAISLFREYSNACSDLESVACEDEYCLGYQTGAQFMLAALAGRTTQDDAKSCLSNAGAPLSDRR